MVSNITHIYTYLMYIMNINQLQKKKERSLAICDKDESRRYYAK